MAAVRASAASGAAAAMATAVRESEASGVIAAMAMSDGYGGRLAASQTATLGTAVAKATAVGGSERRKSVSARAAAWELWFVSGSGDPNRNLGLLRM